MTLATARKMLQRYDMVIRKDGNEYRVNYKDGTEATAYYTSDLIDAADTGLIMASADNRRALQGR